MFGPNTSCTTQWHPSYAHLKFEKLPFLKNHMFPSQNTSPQAPWNPSQKMLQITLVSLDKVLSRLDKMAPPLCPFEIPTFDFPRFQFRWFGLACTSAGSGSKTVRFPVPGSVRKLPENGAPKRGSHRETARLQYTPRTKEFCRNLSARERA